jgi:Plasmid pRiA4b ORF-3-like protein
MIMRTIEVPAVVTLAVLNEAMLILFGWSGEHLHKFTIRAVGYSTDWVVDAV